MKYPHEGVYPPKNPWMAYRFGGYPCHGVFTRQAPSPSGPWSRRSCDRQRLLRVRHPQQALRGLLAALFLVVSFILAGMPGPVHAQIATGSLSSNETFLQDEAKMIKEPIRAQILAVCREIETTLKIKVLIRTEQIDDITQFSQKVETFFLDWIRDIDMDKRGLLLFAVVAKDSMQGRVALRAGIGLKYLVTREMGERILNRVIIPNNAEKNDGKAFLEGVLAIKGMLIDEFKREQQRQATGSESFDIFSFFWRSKELMLALCIGVFLCYLVFFIERCPRCNGNLNIVSEILKEPGVNTMGLGRKTFSCTRCGFSRRKKEPIFPSGKSGLWMWLSGDRRNDKVVGVSKTLPPDFSSEDRRTPPE